MSKIDSTELVRRAKVVADLNQAMMDVFFDQVKHEDADEAWKLEVETALRNAERSLQEAIDAIKGV